MESIIRLSHKTITLQRQQLLKAGGSTDTHIYYVEEGSLRVFVISNAEEQNIRFGYRGNLIVSLDSFLSGRPSPLYIQALKKTVVRVISKAQFDAYIHSEGNLAVWTSILENLVLQQMERENDLLISSPAERYRRVLERSPQLFQEIPHRHIANYLRMSAETLSRLKKKC